MTLRNLARMHQEHAKRSVWHRNAIPHVSVLLCLWHSRIHTHQIRDFALAPFVGYMLGRIILFTASLGGLPLLAETQPVPFAPFFFVEQPVAVAVGEQSRSHVFYINGRGFRQSYEKRGTALHRVVEQTIDAKAVESLLRKLIAAAKTDVFDLLPSDKGDVIGKTELQIIVAFSESRVDQHWERGRRLTGQVATLLQAVQALESKSAIPPSKTGAYLRAVLTSDAPPVGRQSASPVYDLRTASASKCILLSRAIENPCLLVPVPAGRNPFSAFIGSFSTGDYLTLQVSKHLFTVSSFAVTTE